MEFKKYTQLKRWPLHKTGPPTKQKDANMFENWCHMTENPR